MKYLSIILCGFYSTWYRWMDVGQTETKNIEKNHYKYVLIGVKVSERPQSTWHVNWNKPFKNKSFVQNNH